MSTTERETSRTVAAVDWLFESWRFPAFVLFLTLGYKVLLIALLLLPTSGTALGAFTEDFKVWCFGYDPATGKMQTMYVASMLSEPLVLCGAVLMLWGKPLREIVRRRPRLLLPSGGSALFVLLVASVAMGALHSPEPKDRELPFPAEALRTKHTPPAFVLENQIGNPTSLEGSRGEVVLITGVYASCGLTCPMIMGQAKRALAQLSPAERAHVSVVAVTLDPEHDTRERLAEMATAQGVSAPQFNLCTGAPATVNALLDDFGIRRERNPATGIIDHANMFLLVDRSGRIAYRFTLGDRQERWLVAALRILVGEGPR